MEAREPVGCEIIIIKNLPPSGTALFIPYKRGLSTLLHLTPFTKIIRTYTLDSVGSAAAYVHLIISPCWRSWWFVVGTDAGGGLFIYTLSTVTVLLKLNRFLVGGVYTRDECEPYKWGPWTQSSAQLNSDQFATTWHGADE